MKKISIALLAGGWSKEREVSLKSGETVYSALDKDKYNVMLYDPRDDLVSLIDNRHRIDLAINLLHGEFGEDGRLQGFLDIMGIPFLGSGTVSSAVSFNKAFAKQIYAGAGLKILDHVILNTKEKTSLDRIIGSLGQSTVVKPLEEGSSIGVSICHGRESLQRGIEDAFKFGSEIMVERYVKGREVTCCVIGNDNLETLPIIEIIPKEGYEFFDYEAKYTLGATKEVCPALLSDDTANKVRLYAKKAHRALKCRAWSRSDMIIEDKEIYILETNTVPGMTETSLVPLSANVAGMTLTRFLDRLIELSICSRSKKFNVSRETLIC